ncbi:MAG: hypothetical protein IPK76_14180 [Lewinellaceae bacterium]|nr:hypothetical protein [Lewinellaceae bacterium]
MKKSNQLLFAIVMLALASPLFAQKEDLTKDTVFFIQQAKLYQRWLEHNGLGKTLHVKTIEVEPQQIALYLAFPTENADSVSAAWMQLKKDYAAQNTGLSLEQELFYKMLHMMEVRQSAANVQLYDTYDTRKEPCFYRGIYVKDGVFKIDTGGCKSKRMDVYISPGDLSGAKKHSVEAFQKQFTQEYVFDKIHRYARQRYERKTCENRTPVVSPQQIDGNMMRFDVVDLCKEVLKDEQNSSICAFLSKYVKPCNWIKREKLTLTFIYQSNSNGFLLKCEVEGKVGSGFYDEVGRGGYLDMEIDFDGYLTDYANKLQYELKQAILK